jgi:hypothetical protein
LEALSKSDDLVQEAVVSSFLSLSLCLSFLVVRAMTAALSFLFSGVNDVFEHREAFAVSLSYIEDT